MILKTPIAGEFEADLRLVVHVPTERRGLLAGLALNFDEDAILFGSTRAFGSWDDSRINDFIPMAGGRFRSPRMIYIGDKDDKDICMKLVKEQRGYSIAVFRPGPEKAVAERLPGEPGGPWLRPTTGPAAGSASEGDSPGNHGRIRPPRREEAKPAPPVRARVDASCRPAPMFFPAYAVRPPRRRLFCPGPAAASSAAQFLLPFRKTAAPAVVPARRFQEQGKRLHSERREAGRGHRLHAGPAGFGRP